MTNVHIPLSMKTGPGKSNVSLNNGDGKNVFFAVGAIPALRRRRKGERNIYDGEFAILD